MDEAITTIVVSLDGAYVLMREDGYREAMVGNISLYDVTGKRQHTVYIGEAPEYGKGTFFQRLEKEIATVKKHYPDALYLGIADGAKNNWSFLEQHTSRQLLDFFHVTEYLANVAYAAYPGKTDKPSDSKALNILMHSIKTICPGTIVEIDLCFFIALLRQFYRCHLRRSQLSSH